MGCRRDLALCRLLVLLLDILRRGGVMRRDATGRSFCVAELDVAKDVIEPLLMLDFSY